MCSNSRVTHFGLSRHSIRTPGLPIL
jgi:hypothetical protein